METLSLVCISFVMLHSLLCSWCSASCVPLNFLSSVNLKRSVGILEALIIQIAIHVFLDEIPLCFASLRAQKCLALEDPVDMTPWIYCLWYIDMQKLADLRASSKNHGMGCHYSDSAGCFRLRWFWRKQAKVEHFYHVKSLGCWCGLHRRKHHLNLA